MSVNGSEEESGGGNDGRLAQHRHHQVALGEAVDQLARVVKAARSERTALVVVRRRRVLLAEKQIVRIFGANVVVVVDHFHRRHPVWIVIAADLLERAL